ncbi:MAG TPA: histidine kinase dimerization/phospho-acceptor domain-containing protein, partial [Actinomycetota bacterium]|nr:histidine kinase dimerization/phospho-acceptor domain-containing protein [Actinomycetota bacterium]
MERTTVRGRTTLLAVLVVGVALLVAWFAVVRILSLTQEAAVRDAASLRAADFVALLESGATPDDLRIGLEEDVLVQVVDDSGAVVAASPSLEARAPIAQLDPGGSVTIEDTPTEPDDSFLVVARAARHPTETFTILVGRNLDSVTEASAVVTLVLGSSIPLLLFIVGATTWKVVGRALEPVERMRARAEEISAGDLGLRIPGSGTDDELGRLGRTLNEMLERLERARLTQQRFVSDASHELRNPIAAIRQHAESALAHPETTDVPRLAEEVTREALRLQHLTEDLLFFARSAEASAPIRLDRLRMDEVVLEVVRRSVRSPDLRIDTSAVD